MINYQFHIKHIVYTYHRIVLITLRKTLITLAKQCQ